MRHFVLFAQRGNPVPRAPEVNNKTSDGTAIAPLDLNDQRAIPSIKGGRQKFLLSTSTLFPYIISSQTEAELSGASFVFIDHVDAFELSKYSGNNYVHANVPLHELADQIGVTAVRKIAQIHSITGRNRASISHLSSLLSIHSCPKCNTYVSVFRVAKTAREKRNDRRREHYKDHKEENVLKFVEAVNKGYTFPPEPLTDTLT